MSIYLNHIVKCACLFICMTAIQKVSAQHSQHNYEQASRSSEKMKVLLSLTDNQTEQVRQLEHARLVERDSIAALGGSLDQRQQWLLDAEQTFRAQLKKVLTADQWQAYNEQMNKASKRAADRAAASKIRVQQIKSEN